MLNTTLTHIKEMFILHEFPTFLVFISTVSISFSRISKAQFVELRAAVASICVVDKNAFCV